MVCCLCSITFILAIYNVHVKFTLSNTVLTIIFHFLCIYMNVLSIQQSTLMFNFYQPSCAFKVCFLCFKSTADEIYADENYFPRSRFVVCQLCFIAFMACRDMYNVFVGCLDDS